MYLYESTMKEATTEEAAYKLLKDFEEAYNPAHLYMHYADDLRTLFERRGIASHENYERIAAATIKNALWTGDALLTALETPEERLGSSMISDPDASLRMMVEDLRSTLRFAVGEKKDKCGNRVLPEPWESRLTAAIEIQNNFIKQKRLARQKNLTAKNPQAQMTNG